jgi:hypothetical protein
LCLRTPKLGFWSNNKRCLEQSDFFVGTEMVAEDVDSLP